MTIGSFNRQLKKQAQIFRKGVVNVGHQISSGLGSAAGGLQKGGNFVAKLTSDPKLNAAVGILAPELAPTLAAGNALAQVAKAGAGDLRTAQSITNGSAFQGGNTKQKVIDGISHALTGAASIQQNTSANIDNVKSIIQKAK